MQISIENLRKKLSQPLPGQEAQALMMPSLSDNSRFSLAAKDGAKPGGVMILLYPRDGILYFPLIQRPDYDGVHAKQMSLPGGKKDKIDKDLIETALRETEEEIGIERNDIEVIGSLTELFIIASNFNVLPTIGFLSSSPTFIADDYEVDEIIEVNLDHLMQPGNLRQKELKMFQGVTINAPYFDLNNKVVWGATAMILSELKQVLLSFYK